MKTTDPVDAARLELMLTELRLPAIKILWPRFADQADKEGWPAARFLAALGEHEIAEREFPPFEDSQVISALGLDSLSTLEMVGMIERELDVYLPTDELTDIHTVGELANLIEQKLGTGA